MWETTIRQRTNGDFPQLTAIDDDYGSGGEVLLRYEGLEYVGTYGAASSLLEGASSPSGYRHNRKGRTARGAPMMATSWLQCGYI